MNEEINIQDYWKIVKKRKNIVLVFFFTVVTVVTIASFMMPPVYRASAILLIDLESPNVLTATGEVSLGPSNYYTYKEYFQSQVEIIKSRSLLRQVFEQLNLESKEKYKEADDPISKFSKSIEVNPVRDTRLLIIAAEGQDPELAAKIANALAKAHVTHNLVYITKSEVLNLHKNEYLKLQAKLTEYSKIYKLKHPKMIRLMREIQQMKETIQQEKQQLTDQSTSSNSDKFEISSSLLAGLKANNITIQDPAVPPVKPFKPKKRLNVLLSILVGFFGGVGLVFFFEYLDNTVKEAEDVERLVKWPFLGHVPKITTARKTPDSDRDFFVSNNPKDPVTENYRTIRTSVLFSSTEEHPVRSLLVTSPGPQEGKTITLCNLGITMAQNRSKVLLVDADMRRPRLHKTFDKSNVKGLSNFLSGQDGFESVIQSTGIANLNLVCSGPHPPDPSELLSSHKLEEFIDFAKQRYDFILFDTAPSAVVTDAVVLSRLIDGVVIVVESAKTNKNILPRINQAFQKTKARVIGFILNKITLSGADYQYQSYYYGK